MATEKLGLPKITGNMNADIVRDMNALADAIDGKAGTAGGLATLDAGGKVPAGQLNISAPADASTTTKGITKLNSAINSSDETTAATPKAIKTVNDTLAAHQADYVKHPGFGVTTSSGNAYSITLNPAATSYVDGMGIVLKINADSTGAATINVNGLGAKPLKNANGNDVTNLKKDGVYTFRYANGNFIQQGEGVDATPLIAAVNNILAM